MKGQWEESIEVYINSLIDTYCYRMVEAGKTTEEMANILRNIVGTCGMFMYLVYYILRIQDTAPVDAENKSRHHDAQGILGLKFMCLAFGTDYVSDSATAAEIRAQFDSFLKEEVDNAQHVFASARGRRMQSRKSSMMRAMNRRLSDTEMLHSAMKSIKRFSISGSIKE
jgi:hypothetical protein